MIEKFLEAPEKTCRYSRAIPNNFPLIISPIPSVVRFGGGICEDLPMITSGVLPKKSTKVYFKVFKEIRKGIFRDTPQKFQL